MLYHANTGIPFNVSLPSTLKLSYSQHALQAARTDRYGNIQLVSSISTAGFEVIEVETDNSNRPIKILLRGSYNGRFDICLAVLTHQQSDGYFKVKTVWLNEKNDTHNTLEVSRYCRIA